MQPEWINALIGGVIIGISVSVMLLFNGRVTGISGIFNGILAAQKGDTLWRVLFTLGLILGGVTLGALKPEVFSGGLNTDDWTVAAAGLIVGFGTIMGSGCTSGHGVCGISRLSMRGVLATVTFIVSGVISIVIFRLLGVYS